MTLDQFIKDLANDVAKFRTAYLEKHEQNPEHYPFELPDDNDGVWLENFLTYLQSGNV